MKFAASLLMAAALLWPAAGRAQEPQDAQDAPNAAAATAATTADTTTVATTDRPYETIVARNMFGLVPIPPPAPPPPPPVDPPPKITLTGIMTIFGRDQALFKVANNAKGKPGQPPAPETSCVLAVGERQEDVEVVNIDHEKGIVSFNNHGEPQEISLLPAKDTGGPGSGSGNSMAGFPLPRSAAERAAMMQARQGRPAASAGSPSDPNSSPGTRTIGGVTVNERGIYVPQADTSLTPEQNVLLIEAQRMKYLQEGNPMADVLPPTPLTELNKQENGRGAN